MSTTNIAIINGISVQVMADEREQLVAVKPVCDEDFCIFVPGKYHGIAMPFNRLVGWAYKRKGDK